MRYLVDIEDEALSWYSWRAHFNLKYLTNMIQHSIAATTMIPSYQIKVEEYDGKEKRKK